jgi:hypothetical protein
MVRKTLQILAVLFCIAASTVVIASPASAGAAKHNCGSGFCLDVYGSGNHVSPKICVYNTLGYSVSGHMQVRWHHNGVDSTENSGEGYVRPSPQTCKNFDFLVDPSTYICARWWHWTGSSWILTFGDYKCVKAPL